MKLFKIAMILALVMGLQSCATGYQMIQPQQLAYKSTDENKGIILHYKYDVLRKKYAKKEFKKGVKVVAVKITNNADRAVRFGTDIYLTYDSNAAVNPLDPNITFNMLKQSTASYLFYMLLTPMQFSTTETNSRGITETTSSTPIGLAIGPGITAANMITAGSANKKFKQQLLHYDLNGVMIEKGATVYGLIGVQNNAYDALKIAWK